MPIRNIQRLIFGSLIAMMLILIGSVWMLALWFSGEKGATPAYKNPIARVAPLLEFDFPAEEIWAQDGGPAVAREIEHYVLTGTFQTYEMEQGSTQELAPARSVALVDDQRSGRQVLLRQGDTLGPFQVTFVGKDQMTLKKDEQIFVLSLTGEVAMAPVEQETEPEAEPIVRLEDMPALETSRFGKKVSENQWVIDREEVFQYAEEVMNNPLRVVQLYRSFDQVAQKEGDKAGFRIEMKGEQDFFRDMGLGDGDIIRKVNSMEMRTQIRAEYLMREFMKSRMSAVVLDVERDGETRQQIFIVR